MDALLSATSLPNLHPAVVHFPIALLVAAVGFDVAGLALRRAAWLDRTAATLLFFGALGAWTAVLTGERAADSLVNVPALVQPFVDEHEEWAERTAWFFSIVAVARLVLLVADRGTRRPWRLPVRVSLLAAAVGGLWLVFGTADRGGALVYVHGLAVAKPESASLGSVEVSPTVASPVARCVRAPDGRITWEPLPDDLAALGSVVELVEGSAPVRLVPAPGGGAVGLGIEVSGRSILVLPDELGDVQVEASVDASAFRGTLGVVHHVREMRDAGAFELSTEGRAALVSEQPAGRKVLDEASCTAPGCPCTLTVSAVGRHFKGIVDGATVVHGHMDPREAGRVGLLLDGAGIVRVHSLGAIPVSEEKGAGSPDGTGRSRS